jgi:hypothetical protein
LLESARCKLPKAWHHFEKGVGRRSYLIWRNCENSVVLVVLCWNRCSQWCIVMDAWCLCSVVLENGQIVLGHCWSLVKTEWEGSCTGDE